jgi:hypothetical protein
MKINKSVFTIIIGALMFGTANANPLPLPGFYEFETLNFCLVAAQQTNIDTLVSSNSLQTVIVSTAAIRNSKLTSKDLLNFLATAFNTNWPTGAKLALDNFSGDIFVVDKTGTNPVCNVSVGINGDTNVAYFSYDTGDVSVYKDNSLAAYEANLHHSVHNGVIYRQTRYGKIFFHLFSEQNGYATTDLSFDGLDVTDFIPKDNVVFQSDVAPVTGTGFMNLIPTVITGQVTGSGKWGAGPPPVPVISEF